MADARELSAAPVLAKPEEWLKSRKNEIKIALIGLASTIATGIISNWSQVRPVSRAGEESAVTRRATSDFETELRYLFEVSGSRASFYAMQAALVAAMKNEITEENPGVAAEVFKLAEDFTRNPVQLDAVLRKMLPVYRRHFTVGDLQKLNQFYSTEAFQRMVEKMPPIAEAFAAEQVELMKGYRSRAVKLLELARYMQPAPAGVP